jgi:hypothetical protein
MIRRRTLIISWKVKCYVGVAGIEPTSHPPGIFTMSGYRESDSVYMGSVPHFPTVYVSG